MKIAIFGGSFDPPHIGHEQIVNLILNNLDIDLLFIIPTYLSPFKKEFCLLPKERLTLINKLFWDEKKVVVSNYEVNSNRSVPTIDTVRYLSLTYKISKIYLIIGDDHLKSLHLWDSFDELQKRVEFVVINRNNTPTNYKNIPFKLEVSSSAIRDDFNINLIPTKIQNEVKEIWKKELNK
ncbi:MAG: nicotinate (nicotinamide) nucleotide adenylyltransferase [Arcobacteraceae bacterium]|jgi:nicotinate-nucleotide adenylyltransferase|nr:nicotinate (nicotinamide) nucleotide adenylyltransferase [Arcobacteraceae bacterium]MDY0364817.1 nicotinate (nicotinamide) nucleotide adenylyltransferase [Arcobacteraceae bacterium]